MSSTLSDQKIMGFVPTKDPKKARTFFENVLGLRFVVDDKLPWCLTPTGPCCAWPR
jgi:hypothetical protein